jgi:hypothetical protein
MTRSLTIPLGIVVAREKVVHPIADVRWRAVELMLDPPPKAVWREVRRGPGFQHYHAATLPLVLINTHIMDYRVNLANGVPCVYVVLQARDGASEDTPIDVRAISASPFAIDLFPNDGLATVERVVMPGRLVAMVERFITDCGTAQPSAKTARALREEPRDDIVRGSEPFYGFAGRLSPSE